MEAIENGGSKVKNSDETLTRMTDLETTTNMHFTPQEGIEACGFGLFQIKIMFILMFLHMGDATEMMLLSVISTPLACEWGLHNWQLALTSTVIFAGMSASSPLWGVSGDIFGRKPTLILSGLLTSYFGILAAFSPSYISFLIIRSCVGLFIPGSYLAGMTLMEFLPINYRSKITVLFQLSWAIGSCLETGLATMILPTLGWRWLMAISALPLFISSLGVVAFVPESFRYCAVSGDDEQALKTFRIIAKQNKKHLPPGSLKLVDYQQVKRARFSELFTKEYCLTTILTCSLCYFATFLFFGNILLTSQAIDHKYNPCNAASKRQVNEANCACSTISASEYVQMIIHSSGELIAAFISICLLDLIGRKRTIGVVFFTSGVLIGVLQVCIPDILRSALGFLIRGFSLSSITAVIFYISEVYPTTNRSIALGLSGSFIRLGSMTTPFLAQMLPDRSFTLTYCIYCGIGIFAALISLFLRIETKGQSLKDYSH